MRKGFSFSSSESVHFDNRNNKKKDQANTFRTDLNSETIKKLYTTCIEPKNRLLIIFTILRRALEKIVYPPEARLIFPEAIPVPDRLERTTPSLSPTTLVLSKGAKPLVYGRLFYESR